MPFDPKDPETMAAVKELIAAAVEEATEGLETKKAELLGEVRKLKKSRGETVDPEEHERVTKELERVQTDLAKLQKESKKQIDTLTADVTAKDSTLKKHLVDDGITNALVGANVQKHFLPTLKAAMAQSAKVELVDGVYVAQIDGKPLADHVKAWAGTDEGKHFIGAPANGGGGGGGTKGTTGVPGGNPWATKDFSVQRQTEIYRENPEQARQMASAAGINLE